MFEVPVPVFVKPLVISDEQKFQVWNPGGKNKVVDSTIKPYAFVRNGMDTSDVPETSKKLMLPLSTRKPTITNVAHFNNLPHQREFIDSGRGFNPTANYIDNVIELEPDFFKNVSSNDSLKVMFFDIEQYTDGTKFPEKVDPVISIAWAINDEKPECVAIKNFRDEKDVIYAFAKAIKENDPDVIVGFNHCFYDVPVLMTKFEQYGVPNSLWGRTNQEPFLYDKKIGPRDCKCMSVPGRVFYDVYHAALTDQVLHGVGHGLKAVSRFYAKTIGIDADDVIEEDMSQGTARLVGTQELVDYNISDVDLTRRLFKMYFPNTIAIAEFTGAPLNRLVPLASTYAFSRILGNLFWNKGILADSNNKVRYPWAFDTETKTYEGATVQCLKTGLFKDLYEYDVNSLYPSIMASLGIGPDNTQITGTYPGLIEFKMEQKGDIRTYYVPDRIRAFTWIVEVKGISHVSAKIEEFLETRFKLKKLAKETGDKGAFSQAYALKVSANSAYGISGSQFIDYGELGVAVLTTCMGRHILKVGMDYATEQEGGTNLIADTDGFKTSDRLNLDALNECTSAATVSLGGKPIITWSDEHFDVMYIRQMKTYLYMEDGKFTKKGAAFKGSNHANVFNKAIDKVGPVLLTMGESEGNKAALSCTNMTQYEYDDFVMTVRLGRAIKDYDNPNALQPSIARMAEEKRGTPVYPGQNIQYVKTVDGYDLPDENKKHKLDMQYYKKVVNEALSRMGFADVEQTRLSGWF